jgi:hypothetical protein
VKLIRTSSISPIPIKVTRESIHKEPKFIKARKMAIRTTAEIILI